MMHKHEGTALPPASDGSTLSKPKSCQNLLQDALRTPLTCQAAPLPRDYKAQTPTLNTTIPVAPTRAHPAPQNQPCAAPQSSSLGPPLPWTLSSRSSWVPGERRGCPRGLAAPATPQLLAPLPRRLPAFEAGLMTK